MKAKIHPEYITTKVVCSGCGTAFDSMSTVNEMHVDVCSHCHPFYTGKQKLVDTAGRVDRFKAQAAKAEANKTALAQKGKKALKRQVDKATEATAKPSKPAKTTTSSQDQ